MHINPKIFKAYDIRGVYDVDFDDKAAYRLGLAYAKLRKKELNKKDIQIVVGSDMRISSPVLKESLIKGLVESGITVIDIGLSSTPTFYFAVSNYNYDGGIIISASHNPREYNGFKLVRAKAMPIGADTGMEELKELVLNGDLEPSDEIGRIEEHHDVLSAHIQHDLLFSNVKKIRGFKIAIDPSNGMGGQYLEELFKHLPCDLIRMNWEPDGNFPSHEADPFKSKNLIDLCQKVKDEHCDFGVATDGDGDRIFFVDDLGQPVEAGITRAMLCKIFLEEEPGAKIAYDIRPGKITRDVILESGGEPIITKVGHSYIKAKSIEEGVYFAGESSGHFFLNTDIGFFETPIIVLLVIMEELSEKNLSFSQYIRQFQKYYHSGEINTKILNPEAKLQEIKEKYADGELNELDGVSITYDDYWFNVRPSNTEPLLRFTLEANSREIMEKKTDEILRVIRN
ncbi:MAG: phosphomannomutase/phosphoglucomutase [bacterium]